MARATAQGSGSASDLPRGGVAPAAAAAAAAPPAAPARRSLARWRDRVFLLLGLALLGYVLSRYPLGDIGRACLRLGPWVAVTPLIALVWFCCNTTALYLLLDRQVSWWRLLRIRLIGDGYNTLLPLAGLGGEPLKARHLAAFVPVEQAVTALIRDRIVENAVGMLFTSLWLALALGRVVMDARVRAALLVYAGLAAAVGVAIVLVVLTSLPGRVGNRVARWLGASDPRTVRLAPAQLARVLCCYLAARITGTLEVAALFALLGLPVEPLTVLFCYSLHHAAGTVSFAIPGSLGVLEGTSVYLFSVLGYPGPAAVAFALARRARLLVVGLFGVLLHLVLTGTAHRPRRTA
ncbi:MAG: flippase-like domain-containing protein [Deltaproteobacteria bacterium]|nr:flippase-like domain-containing protein [Deltaproteobacteria bacterium]